VVASIVPNVILLLLHMPPAVASLSETILFIHTNVPPVITAGAAITVTITFALHPPATV
jgi:hypothetical protein